jgi:hypothetical protein
VCQGEMTTNAGSRNGELLLVSQKLNCALRCHKMAHL